VGDRRPHERGPRPTRLARHDGGDADADEREDQRQLRNPAIGMLAPVLSANETPAADAIAARTVVATEATTAEATPCFHTGCRSAAGVGALGVVRVGICVVVDMSSSVSSAGRPVRPAHTPSTNERVRIRQVARRSVLRVDAR
jgi:hypothetical protein